MRDAVIRALLSNPTVNAYTIEQIMEVRLPGTYVRVNQGYNSINSLSLSVNHTPVLTLTGQQINNFFGYLANTYTVNTYRNVKHDATWRNVYGVQSCMFEKFDKTHGLMGEYLDATYCRRCRIKLPLKNLTIDHQKPQEGGRTVAILKIFRGFGLTRGGARGNKNTASIGSVAANVGGDASNSIGTYKERYELNEAGVIFYSAIREARQVPALEEACMHHYLNLAPVCGSCNSSMGNRFF
ncbi:MAG: hypothetical protein LUM44_12625 [Pyrinomonadaceae bacterium]|nr:hypothetical protein [Pyrinomonadaceae bacterium]